MPARELQEQLDELREQLDKNQTLSLEEREDMRALMEQIKARMELENATADNSVADNVNLAVERFEVDHPGVAGALRNIVQTLGNIGI
ncbi:MULTISPECIES: DUF4404 family protein [Pseudomonas]|jgi:uncharacterized protein YpuA (DUF1002 family)|uniref:DUF4404 family protein n=1 Tax=Pseudomonas coleopterorum TaxID=1605838 RepID=A0AAJ6M3N8_9PSED|nr:MULTISPECIES: DUF4404 family protein [Pseudomonas]KTC49061.1 chromosome partitioning protein ParA [Pseudomonas putida]KNC16049.1 chromosome partitioning protein ParA [Pseudomonas sp. RIT-PI-a]KQQ62915.1 chromosome partitioning protein ParA [Pseudomonas sp. Leaf129]MDY1015596.1 DUF4404 family protein [Pseudomonas coleopterorum]WNC11616.1 DUF4404 family protein [Pseudomonas coleopterorum]